MNLKEKLKEILKKNYGITSDAELLKELNDMESVDLGIFVTQINTEKSYLLRISERYALRNKGKRRTRIRMDSNPAHVGVGIRIDQIRCRRCILKAPDA